MGRLQVILAQPQYERIRGYESFKDRLAIVKDRNGWGLLDLSSKTLVVPCTYSDLNRWNDLFAAQKEGQWGYLDMAGSVVIAPQFAWAGSFREGVAPVKIGNSYGFIDRTGKRLIRPTYADEKKRLLVG